MECCFRYIGTYPYFAIIQCKSMQCNLTQFQYSIDLFSSF